MTIADGTVGSVTKIVDNGPDSDRWNLVILGDGYQHSELPLYRSDVQRIVSYIQAYAPFHQLWGKINVHMVEVESAQSGADDPAYCASGGPAYPPAGKSSRTYFDSTFCYDGNIRRLLNGDANSAYDTARAQVPDMKATLVVVNSPHQFGGGGGLVAWVSSESDSARIAVHEIAHSYFMLEDEYGEGVPAHLGAGQAPNISTNLDRATTEWRDLILPTTPMDTMPNPYQGRDNTDPSPVPEGTVGMFEGAGRSFHNVYRSEYDCAMRTEGQPFCKVCDRQIRAMLAPFGGAMSWEMNGNNGTNPSTDFLGTTDNKPLVIKVNNLEQVQVTVSEVKFKSGIDLGGNINLFHRSSTSALGKIWTTNSPTPSLNLSAGGKNPGPSITIDTNGFVGIGTNRPDSRLEVNNGNLLMQAPPTATGHPGAILFRGPVGGAYKARIWSEPSAGTGLHLSNGAPQPNLTIDETGFVGIGTADPGAKLEVNAGDLLLKAAAAAAADPGAVVFQNGSGYQKARIWYQTAGDTGLHLSGRQGLTPDISINPSGNVGIGVPSPGSKLDVRSSDVVGVAVMAGNIAGGAAINAFSTSTQLPTLMTQNYGSTAAINGHAMLTTTTSFGVVGLAGNNTFSPVAAFDGGIGVVGCSSSGTGVAGMTDGLGAVGNGVEGWHLRGPGAGIHGLSHSPTGAGVYGENVGGGYAGYFHGNVGVVGTISTSVKQFKIDHPLEPAEKFLIHSSVESPDMMNVYNGNITTDADCQAVVELPSYFEALNRDFRYQLTVLGKLALVAVAREIKGNRFVIQSDRPKVKVSWQVTGVRKDAYAKAHPMKVEQVKNANERGRYLHPELYPVVSDKPDAKLPIGSLARMIAKQEKSSTKRKPKPKAKTSHKKSAA